MADRSTPISASAIATTTPVRSLPAAQCTSGSPVGVRDQAQGLDHRVGAVEQVPDVEARRPGGHTVAVDAGVIALLPRQHDRRIAIHGSDVSVVPRFGKQRQVPDGDARFVRHGARTFVRHLDGGAQIGHRTHLVVVDECSDVRGRQPLQVVRADQPVSLRHATVDGRQPTEIPNVDSALQGDPAVRLHESTLPSAPQRKGPPSCRGRAAFANDQNAASGTSISALSMLSTT